MPNNVNEEIQKFINEVKKILGDRLKKLFYMVLMQGEIIIRNLM